MTFPAQQDVIGPDTEPGVEDPSESTTPDAQIGTDGDTSPAAPDQSATDAIPAEPGELQSELQEAQSTIESLQEDINRTKSTFQSELERVRGSYEQSLQEHRQYIEQLELERFGDDEEAKQEYLRKRREQQLEQQKQQLTQREQQILETQHKMGWHNWFVNELGVPEEQLETQGDLRALHDSGHKAVKSMVADMRDNLNLVARANEELLKLAKQNGIEVPDNLASVAASVNTQAPQRQTRSPRQNRVQPQKVVSRQPSTEATPKTFHQLPWEKQQEMLDDYKAGRITKDDFQLE